MNSLSKMITRGTFGEVAVQLNLLRFGVQAAPPIKDSGNDLIAIRGNDFRAIQVKSTAGKFPITVDLSKLPARYHVLALVKLANVEMLDKVRFNLSLDSSSIFLVEKERVKGYFTEKELQPFALSMERINTLFPGPVPEPEVEPEEEPEIERPMMVRKIGVTQIFDDPFAEKGK